MANVKTLRGTFAARPATAKNNVIYFATDSQLAYIYENGAWVTLGPLNPCTPPPTTGWTALTTNGESFDTSKGALMMQQTPSGTIASWRKRTQPSTPYTITVGLLSTLPNGANNAVYPIGFRQSSTQEVFMMLFYQGALQGFKWTSDGTVFVSSAFNIPVAEYPRWAQITNDGTNLTFRYSFDGFNFTQAYTETLATFLTPDEVMVGILSNSTATIGTAMTIFHWEVT